MRTSIISCLFILAFGFSIPAAAQHMNAKDAPCQQPASNAETGQCFNNAAKVADTKLNQTYSAIRTFLESQKRTLERDALVKAQRLWIGFRDADCAAQRSLYDGGTGAPATYWACMEAVIRQRTEDLKTGYGWLLEKFDHPLKD
jgi:uncharacterized protein YecT (DUF1311 family)